MSWTEELIVTSAMARSAVKDAIADVDADVARRAAAPTWQPIVPLASGALRRPPQAGVRMSAGPEPGTESCAFDVPHDVAVRFRTLCAMRGLDQRRVLERLVRSWVILGLADPGASPDLGLGGRPA